MQKIARSWFNDILFRIIDLLYEFIYFNKSPFKMMKNAFYFNLKALFVLKIFPFLF